MVIVYNVLLFFTITIVAVRYYSDLEQLSETKSLPVEIVNPVFPVSLHL